MSWRTKVGRRLAWERGTMNVGDRVKWLPTGQEGRIFEVRDGGIVAVRGDGWAVYDYADRFELVNEPVSGRDGPDMAERTHAVIDARFAAKRSDE